MWPFFRRAQGETQARRPVGFAQLVSDIGDFSDLREHDVALKFWLPAPAMGAFNELCQRQGDSASEAMRQFFAQHCYGVYAFSVMSTKHPDLFKEPDIRFSRSDSLDDEEKKNNARKRIATYWVPELGKNVAPIKVWLPMRMRNDLQSLADHVGIKLSQYVREIVIARMLGHGTLPYRPKMLDAEPLQAIEHWCEGREIPMRETSEDECRNHLLGEIRMTERL